MFAWEDPKNPTEIKDYAFDWTTDLNGDTIASCSAEFVDGVDAGMVIEDDAGFAGVQSFVWVSGGTIGLTAKVRGHIVTTDGRTFADIGLMVVAETVDPATAALEDLQADLVRLKSARLSMLTGTSVKEVWRDGRRLVYNVASVADLERTIKIYEGYIADATAATGAATPRYRALSVRF